MQKHHGSTVFILALIAVLAVGSYYFLNTQYPHVKAEVKGDWTGIAEVEDVFGASAAAPAAATPPAEVSAGGSAGDDYAAADDYSDYEEQYGAYEEEVAAAPEAAPPSYDEQGAGDYGLEDGPYADYAAEDTGSNRTDGASNYQDYEDDSYDSAAAEPEGDYGPDHGSAASSDDYSTDSYASDSYSDDYASNTGSSSYEDDYAAEADSASPATTTAAATPRQRSHVESIPKPKGDAPDAADRVYQWWPDSRRVQPTQFTVSYAGQQANTKAVAVLFSRPPDLQSMNQHARILNNDGEPVSGSWSLAGNPRMVHFTGVKRGRYTVVVSKDVTDTNGRAIGITLSGPVYIN